jgi:DnaJ-class molecular chaperone
MQERSKLFRFSFINKYFLIKLGIIMVLWYANISAYIAVKDLEPLRGFVPFEILGVSRDASLSAIKKAYRGLSRELHPDKNRDNPEAVNNFIEVTKAYTVST